MAATFSKNQYAIAVLRGRTTKYFYGATLKECFTRLRPGEGFVYVKYTHGGERTGEFNGKSWVEVR